MFRFNIRDLLWLTLLAAIVVAWWVDRRAQTRRIDELEKAAATTWVNLGDLDLSEATITLTPADVKSRSTDP